MKKFEIASFRNASFKNASFQNASFKVRMKTRWAEDETDGRCENYSSMSWRSLNVNALENRNSGDIEFCRGQWNWGKYWKDTYTKKKSFLTRNPVFYSCFFSLRSCLIPYLLKHTIACYWKSITWKRCSDRGWRRWKTRVWSKARYKAEKETVKNTLEKNVFTSLFKFFQAFHANVRALNLVCNNYRM